MAENSATTGVALMESFELDFTGSANVLGTEQQVVEDACTDLDTATTGVRQVQSNLTAAQQQFLAGWEGATADKFAEIYPALVEELTDVADALAKFRTFAQEASTGYANLDKTN